MGTILTITDCVTCLDTFFSELTSILKRFGKFDTSKRVCYKDLDYQWINSIVELLIVLVSFQVSFYFPSFIFAPQSKNAVFALEIDCKLLVELTVCAL